MTGKLNREDLMSLEEYARARPEFRLRAIAQKKRLRTHLGDHVTLMFEDRLTMQYQIQEMLRVERIFEEEGIQDELDAYNPLIPDGRNWKATMLIEYEDPEERKQALAKLIDIEDKVWISVAGHTPVTPIADEDLDRDTDEKTSSVHFLRFELTEAMADDLKAGAALALGVDHPEYMTTLDPVGEELRTALLEQLD